MALFDDGLVYDGWSNFFMYSRVMMTGLVPNMPVSSAMFTIFSVATAELFRQFSTRPEEIYTELELFKHKVKFIWARAIEQE